MKGVTILIALASAASVLAADPYHVLRKIPIGGEGCALGGATPCGWDFLTVDSAARRLYVSHATHVEVIDVDAGKVVGDIPDTPGVHGIALAPELGRGFVSNGRGNDVTVFDLKTLKTLDHVKTGENPDDILYDAASGRVFTFNGRSHDVTAINAKTGAVEGTIPVGGRPEVAQADGKGKVYVNIQDTSEIVEIDARALKVTKRYSLKPCEEPSGLAMDMKNRRLFSACGNKIMVVSDPDKGKILATPATGAGPDGAAFDPDRGLAFSSNGDDGTLTVVSTRGGKYEVVENAATQRGARTVTIDLKTHKLFLPTAEFGPAPAPTPENPRPRPTMVKDSFIVLVVGR